MIGRSDHPTPDDVYEDVATRVQGISRGTGWHARRPGPARLIVRVGHPGTSARYDGHTERHHHLVCEECGAIRDLEDAGLDALEMPNSAGRGSGCATTPSLPGSLLPVHRAVRLVQEIQDRTHRQPKGDRHELALPDAGGRARDHERGPLRLFRRIRPPGKTSYAPVDQTEPFDAVLARMSRRRPASCRSSMTLLEERYDLADRPAPGVTMSRGKPVQGGVRVKLPQGMTWDAARRR